MTTATEIAKERLGKLRVQLSKHGFDGFLIPRADAWQGEYVSLHDERLKWLTGFTGSAGMAIVMRDRAAIFVDGRYSVQVGRETDLTLYSHQHLHDAPPTDWLRLNCTKGQRIAYDPWLHTPAQIKKLEEATVETGANLIATPDNFIDQIWLDQPTPAQTSIAPYPTKMAGRTSAEKRKTIAVEIQNVGADMLFTALPDNIAWLFNVRSRDVAYNPMPQSFATIDVNGSANWFIDLNKVPNNLDTFDLSEIKIHSLNGLPEFLRKTAANGKKLLLDSDWSPILIKQFYEAEDGQVIENADPITTTKALKNPDELTAMRAANKRDSVAWVKFLHWLDKNAKNRAQQKKPISEIEAAEKILSYRQEQDHFIEPSFASISAADANAALCHYAPSETSNAPINTDTIYLLDSGGQYLDGTTDTTRTIAIGEPSDEVKDRYTRVLKGHVALATLKFPKGTKGHHIDALARMHLWQVGLDYDHGTGHGVGVCLSVHEHPQRIGKAVNDVDLAATMTLTNEPGYYEAERFGMRIENLCEIIEEDDGFLKLKDMTLVPIDTSMIIVEMLSAQERSWLNEYHHRVYSEITPLVDEPARTWLSSATQPI